MRIWNLYKSGKLTWQGWRKELKYWTWDFITHPHLFMPRKYWLLECTMWVLVGWIIIIYLYL